MAPVTRPSCAALAAWIWLEGLAAPTHAADAAPAPADELCLAGGSVIDPERRQVVRADVVIRAGQIQAVAPDAAAGCRGRRLAIDGAFVMPGLIDLHVHSWGNPAPDDSPDEEPGTEEVLRLALRAGVMGMLDLVGNNDKRLALRERLRDSPDHAALFVGAVAPGWRSRGDAAELRARVGRLREARVDVIKSFAGSEGLEVTLAEAARLGLPTVVHISDWEEARAAVRGGASAITHFEDEAVIPADLVKLMAERGTQAIPTMAVQCDLARLVEKPTLLDDPLLARVTGPSLRAAYRKPRRFLDKAQGWVEWQREGCVPHDYVSVRKLHAASVTILAGSDTGNLGTFQGFSLHRELELLTEAGLPPWEALRAGTTLAARFLKRPWGIRAGVPANLLVLDASPLKRISNTRRIRHVIHRGRLVDLRSR
jgi:imidazolonepropionase-like amidohydrolase